MPDRSDWYIVASLKNQWMLSIEHPDRQTARRAALAALKEMAK